MSGGVIIGVCVSPVHYYRIPVQELVKDVDKWKNTLTNSIDSQNAKLSEQVCM